MRVLGLDQGTDTGFAHGEPGGMPISGVIRLGTIKDRGARLNAYRRELLNIVVANSIGKIVFESPWEGPATSNAQRRVSYGLIAVIRMVAAQSNVRCDEISPSEWRKKFGAPTNAPRSVKDYDERRKLIKAGTVRRCRALGYAPRSDDEADATGIWWASCNHILQPIIEPSFEFVGAA